MKKKILKDGLKKEFKMKDLGQAHYCLGMRIQVNGNDGELSLDQEKYIRELLVRFGMEDCNGAPTPLDPNQDLFAEEQNLVTNVPYQELIGSLMYIAHSTRPDIAFAVGLSRFNQAHSQMHWTAVKRVLRYLKRTVNWKLNFKQTNSDLHGFSDSNWGADKSDYKSTTGYVFILSGGAVSWNSRKQPTVAKSTTEAEYMALSCCTSEAVWLKGLHNELVLTKIDSLTIYCDNKGAVDLSKNPTFHPRSKHIGIQHHFVRERVIAGEIEVIKTSSHEMTADILTKGLFNNNTLSCSMAMGLR